MTLYYEDDFVTLYHGDCREAGQGWRNADVLVTDPPYGIAYESNRNRDKRNLKVGRPIIGDASADLRDLILEQWGQRPAIVFGTWRVPRPAATKALVIWHKVGAGGMGDLSMPWLPSHEDIYILGSGFVGKRSGSVLSVKALMSNDASRPDHPTPKPIPLMARLLATTTGTIADPFAGSGSTLIAAKQLGRQATGVEIEERYCEMAANRLAQDVLDFGAVS